MHTLVDFLHHVKGIEYLISVAAMFVFLFFWESLKPKPFKTLATVTADDASYIHAHGLARTIGRIVAAPFIGLFYIISLPIGFAAALVLALAGGAYRMAGKSASFGWRPSEAYLAGKKKAGKADEKEHE